MAEEENGNIPGEGCPRPWFVPDSREPFYGGCQCIKRGCQLRYPGFLSLVCQGVDLYHQDTIQQRELAIFHLQDSFIVKDCATYLFIL